jgi:hypothetical protein
MTEYESGVWDAVALINENEDMELNWRDVMNAITINKVITKHWGE